MDRRVLSPWCKHPSPESKSRELLGEIMTGLSDEVAAGQVGVYVGEE